MKFLYLSRLTIKVHTIVAVEWDLPMPDGCKTTVIHHNISGLPAFQLYSDDSKYEEDKAKLMAALSGTQKLIASEIGLDAMESAKIENTSTDLKKLRLSTRTYHDCLRVEFDSVEKLEAISDFEMMGVKNFGTTKINEIRECIRYYRDIQP